VLETTALLTGTSAGTIQEHLQITSHRHDGKLSSCKAEDEFLLVFFLGVENGLNESGVKVPGAKVTERSESNDSSSFTADLTRIERSDGLVRNGFLLLLPPCSGDVNIAERRGDDLTGLDVGADGTFFLRNEKAASSSMTTISLPALGCCWAIFPLTSLSCLLTTSCSLGLWKGGVFS
jgi:hypothetical protein